MKAKMGIAALQISKIQAYGSQDISPAGHDFWLEATLKVDVRTRGGFSGEGIDCPKLEWKENIEWFEYENGAWKYKGRNQKDMYAANPTSATFGNWHKVRYLNAKYPPNASPAGMALVNDDKQAKHWIAKNGLTWKISIKDIPGMGVKGGSGGGGGESLLKGDTRRRVIYFDLGFSGDPKRVKCVQVLETLNGDLTIHKFIKQDVKKNTVDNEQDLERWRSQVKTPNLFTM